MGLGRVGWIMLTFWILVVLERLDFVFTLFIGSSDLGYNENRIYLNIAFD